MRRTNRLLLMIGIVAVSASTAAAGTLCTAVVLPAGHGGLLNGITPHLNPGCEVGLNNNDSGHIGDITQLGSGTGSWVFMGKVERGDDLNGTNGALTTTDDGTGEGGGLSGTLSFAKTLFENGGMTFEVLAVLKGGNGQGIFPQNFVAYLLDPSVCGAVTCTYDWQSVFFKDGKATQVSHISLYYRKTTVPEPGTLLLLGTGVAALGMVRRRRR